MAKEPNRRQSEAADYCRSDRDQTGRPQPPRSAIRSAQGPPAQSMCSSLACRERQGGMHGFFSGPSRHGTGLVFPFDARLSSGGFEEATWPIGLESRDGGDGFLQRGGMAMGVGYIGMLCLGGFVGGFLVLGLDDSKGMENWQKVVSTSFAAAFSGVLFAFIQMIGRDNIGEACSCTPSGCCWPCCGIRPRCRQEYGIPRSGDQAARLGPYVIAACTEWRCCCSVPVPSVPLGS